MIADYQKNLIYLLIERLGRAFASKHAAEPLNGSAELLNHLVEFLKV